MELPITFGAKRRDCGKAIFYDGEITVFIYDIFYRSRYIYIYLYIYIYTSTVYKDNHMECVLSSYPDRMIPSLSDANWDHPIAGVPCSAFAAMVFVKIQVVPLDFP